MIYYIYMYIRIMLHERNLSKKRKHMAVLGPAILLHLELAVQSTNVPREPILITEAKIFPRALRGLISTTHLCALVSFPDHFSHAEVWALPSAAALHIKEPPF